MTRKLRYWTISYEEDYINQINQLPIPQRVNIEKFLVELSYYKDPRDFGYTTDCGRNDEDCPYILTIFSGLPFEFMYRMYPNDHKLLFIDCYQFKTSYPQDGQL